MRPTRVEIDLAKLNKNIHRIKSRLNPDTALMAVVKANAYGHGIVKIAKQALKSGATSLGVAIPEEGVQLREAGVNCDILILGGIDVDQIDLAIDYNLSICLFSVDMARLINQIAEKKQKKVKIHVKIDSGMGRIGVRDINEAANLCFDIKNMKYLNLEGIFTHFASADEYDNGYSFKQLEKFNKILAEIQKTGINPKWIHAANTASIINYPQSHFNLVRAGIGLYGYEPKYCATKALGLEPILSWYTKIIYLKEIGFGCSVSYGRTYIAQEPRKVATLPVGYGDGYSRLLSNKGWVIIRGKKAPIIGNICMDQMLVDVSDIPGVQIGDRVILIGQQGNEYIFADDIANIYGTISYEVLTNINNRVPRIYVEDKNGKYH
ncbi:MAG: alanine racemase [Caldicoprobacterales bacterium]|jgi:alanine racemase|nr:alanine racemase [Clostridiales bacterium]